MFLGGATGNDDFILENKNKFEAATNTVHEPLDATKFKGTERCYDRSLGDVILVNRYLVVGTHKVNLGENRSAGKVRCKVLDVREMHDMWCCVKHQAENLSRGIILSGMKGMKER